MNHTCETVHDGNLCIYCGEFVEQSNSKSEDKSPSKGLLKLAKSLDEDTLTSKNPYSGIGADEYSEPPQDTKNPTGTSPVLGAVPTIIADTSLDVLKIAEIIAGDYPGDRMYQYIEQLLKEQQTKLIERIEGEVIKVPECNCKHARFIIKEQREAINKVKESL